MSLKGKKISPIDLKTAKVGKKNCRALNKLKKLRQRLNKFAIMAKFRQIWSHWKWRNVDRFRTATQPQPCRGSAT